MSALDKTVGFSAMEAEELFEVNGGKTKKSSASCCGCGDNCKCGDNYYIMNNYGNDNSTINAEGSSVNTGDNGTSQNGNKNNSEQNDHSKNGYINKWRSS